MILPWMLYTLLVGALVSVAALAAESALKTVRLAVRHVWTAAIALTLLLSASAPFREPPPSVTSLTLGGTVVSTVTATRELTPFENVRALFGAAAQVLREASVKPIQAIAASTATIPRTVSRGIALALIVSSLLSLCGLIIAYARFAKQRRQWPRAELHGAAVRVAPDVGPAVMGIAPPEIIVPQWVLARSDAEQRLLLAHESEHVRAHDPLLLMSGCVAVALAPWNAALWFMWSRLRLATEIDCDQRVLHHGAEKRSYALLLVELSGHTPFFAPGIPAFSHGSTHLEKRLLAMTAPSLRYRFVRRVCAISVVSLALLVACKAELPTASDIEHMDAATVMTKVGKVAETPIYVVDKRRVTEAQAKAIPAERIEGIAITRKSHRDSARIEITLLPNALSNVVRSKSQLDSMESLYYVKAAGMRGDTLAGNVVLTKNGMTIGADTVVVNPADSLLRHVAVLVGKRVGITNPLIIIDGKEVNNNPLVFLNGVELTSQQFSELKLNPDLIESIEVIKGNAARNLYGARATNGVITIKTKK